MGKKLLFNIVFDFQYFTVLFAALFHHLRTTSKRLGAGDFAIS